MQPLLGYGVETTVYRTLTVSPRHLRRVRSDDDADGADK